MPYRAGRTWQARAQHLIAGASKNLAPETITLAARQRDRDEVIHIT
jgi:hypothetical protein